MKNNGKYKSIVETAEQRSNVYGLLAAIFRKELTLDFLKQIKDPGFLEILSGQGVQFQDDFLQGSDDKLIEDLAVEYTRLFLGPDRHISPHESIHNERDDGDWGQLWGADTVAVKKFIETAGLEYKSEFTGLPDHISVELEFMHEAAKRESQAWKEKDSDGAVYCLKMEKKFIDEHLAKWVPSFCDKIIAQAETSFYREIAELTKSFIELEKGKIDNCLLEAQKEESPQM